MNKYDKQLKEIREIVNDQCAGEYTSEWILNRIRKALNDPEEQQIEEYEISLPVLPPLRDKINEIIRRVNNLN